MEGATLFRSHFSKLVSILGRVSEMVCLFKVPFLNFCPFEVPIFFIYSLYGH